VPQSRRRFLAASAALPFAIRSIAQATRRTPRFLILGTDKGAGFYRAPWNAETGEVGPSELALEATRPAFFAPHPTLPILYSANEAAFGNGNVSAVHIDPSTAALTLINNVSALSPGSCFISVDRSARSAFVANYTGGSLTAFELNPDASLNADAALFDCSKQPTCDRPGPNKARQDAPHFHCATISPGTSHVIVCDLGCDAIHVFPSKPSNLTFGHVRVPARPGSGPRHVAFHPNGQWLYCIHEIDCTIDLYDWNPNSVTQPLTLRPGSTISTLASPDHLSQTPSPTACELLISSDGRFAYANTRGENSLVVYRIDPASGLFTEQQRVSTGGAVTRLIAFDPSRRFLLCLNQGASTISVFTHDAATGRLSDTPRIFPAQTPMCVHFV
jgi:6-phosphogluconolactonase